MYRSIFLLLLFFSATFNQLIALYNGNPSSPMMPEKGAFISSNSWLSVKGEYLFDDLYDWKLQTTGHGASYSKKASRTPLMRSHLGLITLNILSRVELFSTLGTLETSFLQKPSSGGKISYHTDPHFSWGIGGRVILAYWGDIQLSVNASCLSCDTVISSLKLNDVKMARHGATVNVSAWQIGVGASYRFQWFIPYIGVDYADLRVKIRHLKGLSPEFPSHRITFKDLYPIGLYFGFGLSLEKTFSLNMEARCFNQNAVSLSANFRF